MGQIPKRKGDSGQTQQRLTPTVASRALSPKPNVLNVPLGPVLSAHMLGVPAMKDSFWFLSLSPPSCPGPSPMLFQAPVTFCPHVSQGPLPIFLHEACPGLPMESPPFPPPHPGLPGGAHSTATVSPQCARVSRCLPLPDCKPREPGGVTVHTRLVPEERDKACWGVFGLVFGGILTMESKEKGEGVCLHHHRPPHPVLRGGGGHDRL